MFINGAHSYLGALLGHRISDFSSQTVSAPEPASPLPTLSRDFHPRTVLTRHASCEPLASLPVPLDVNSLTTAALASISHTSYALWAKCFLGESLNSQTNTPSVLVREEHCLTSKNVPPWILKI